MDGNPSKSGDLNIGILISSMRGNERMNKTMDAYGVATISRLLEIIGLFCKRAL